MTYTLAEAGGVFVREGTILPMALEPSLRTLDDTDTDAAGDADGEAGEGGSEAGDGAGAEGRHPLIGGAVRQPATLVWEVWPGAASSGAGVVEW